MFILITRKLVMMRKTYGVENHVNFFGFSNHATSKFWKIMAYTRKLWQQGRSQAMKTLLHIRRKRRARKLGGTKVKTTIIIATTI